jgi:hypothetical protein
MTTRPCYRNRVTTSAPLASEEDGESAILNLRWGQGRTAVIGYWLRRRWRRGLGGDLTGGRGRGGGRAWAIESVVAPHPVSEVTEDAMVRPVHGSITCSEYCTWWASAVYYGFLPIWCKNCHRYVSYRSGFEQWYEFFLAFGETKIKGYYSFEGTT